MPRDINDVYTLPAGNPVIPGTVISTDWANNTLTDIAQALTDSLDKSNPADAREILGLGTAAVLDVGTLPSEIPQISDLKLINGVPVFGTGQVTVGAPYCTAGGTANSITLSVNGATTQPTSLVAGAQYRARVATTNTGATTMKLGSLIAKTCVTVTGAALPAGYIRTDVETEFTYDSTGDRWVVGRETEYGSNVNGKFWRYADGRQTCLNDDVSSLNANTAEGSLFRSVVDGTWSLPASFVNGELAISPVPRSPSRWGAVVSASTTAIVFRHYAPTSTASTTGTRMLAEGRWY